jgi:aspartyl-tRNA synthetase
MKNNNQQSSDQSGESTISTAHKTIHLICQAKGGVGKSFFTYLVYHKYKEDGSVAYLDLDNTNQTTLSRLKDKARSFNVLDAKKKINREAFLALIENVSLAKAKDTFWVDMGATESIEFLNMLTQTYPADVLKEEFNALGIRLHFDVIIAGGDVYNACVKFLRELNQTVSGSFPITCWINKGRFNAELDKEYLSDIHKFTSENISVKQFGSTENEESDAQLIELIKNGTEIDPTRLSLATRIKYRRLISEIE